MNDFHELVQLAAACGAKLVARKETIAVSESSAGGLINAALVAVPGASAYYIGGGVIYTPRSRAVIAAIAKEEMAGMRSASEAYAQLLARRAHERLGTAWALAETGASGPTGNRYGDAAGHACFAVAGPVERAITLETGSTDREANMFAFARRALQLLDESLGRAP